VTALTLEALTKTFPRAGLVVDSIDLDIEDREFFTLLGPSGCGKSTILRMIAGFEEPTSGRILLGGRDITQDPPNRRGIGLVFQNYALFPHLSVADNVAFGLQVRNVPKTEVDATVALVLEQVQLSGLGSARIDELSGGQQQRVAVARALAISPKLLLMDEPLSNLDAKLREETRAVLRVLHSCSGVTTLYVTHDQAEAMGMSDRIAVLNRGRIQQLAPPEEIYQRPVNRFVADFVGHNNILDATVGSMAERSAVVRLADGTALTVDPERRASGVQLSPGARVGVCLRAESLRLTSSDGAFRGVVRDLEYAGSTHSIIVKCAIGELRVEVPSSTGCPAKGESVGLSTIQTGIHLVGPE
jgi:iron(III) transport system ATP-binding protein